MKTRGGNGWERGRRMRNEGKGRKWMGKGAQRIGEGW